ncbi:MAG: NAD-dependent epimerase/dehydratase family protein [Pseudomonadales bacterium]|nr:NAD-dependent epimerase/dehydratase family protein [Pseudomonadales bacterium]
MAPVPKGGLVAVTGAAGFIGGWVVRRLLERGYRVRACVRDVDDLRKTAFLKALPGHASGRLTLHAADLDQDGCFDSIFAGCQGVCHVSHVSTYDDPAYVRRVCDHVIASVNRSNSVNRVIVTSSIAAVMSEADINELVRRPVIFEDRYPDEANPKRRADRGQGYSMGKVIAERAFAEAAESHGGWDAIGCCPGDNVGPILSAHHKDSGPWQHFIELMLIGRCVQNGAYRPWMTVDVRDDADCHIGLLESVAVKNGERYVACSTERRNVEDVCASIDRLLPELGHDTPAVSDDFPERIRAREAELRAIWAGTELRNDRVRAVTGVRFRPLDDSIRDCVESLLAVGGVRPKVKPGFPARV